MAVLEKSRIFQSEKLDSRIRSANVTGSERWLGFFASPALIYIAYVTMSGTYLNQFYVDVLKLGGVAGGAFLVLLPILSKVFDAITNLLMGVVIDRTKTRQGKARPWLLISGPILAVTGILLYAVPQMSLTAQAIWVGVSYNLYFAFAFTTYNMSQALLVPLSTRNTKQRDSLALFLSMGQSMIPGALVFILVPMLLLPAMGVDRSRWALIMSIISILMLPGVLMQYYFTKERVSEDATASKMQAVRLIEQIKTCFTDKYWLLFFGMFLLHNVATNIYNSSINFYSNWVLGTYNDGITLTLINAVGQAPMGLGVFLLWPIAKRFGKRRTLMVGMLIAALGSFIVSVVPTQLGPVLGAFALKSFGYLPAYLYAAMMAEAMDHIEWKKAFRCDGFTATTQSVIVTITAGLGTSLFNSGLARNGYVPPVSDTSWVAQNAATKHWFVLCVAVIPAVIYILISVLAFFYRVEDDSEQIKADITARHRAEAEAAGLVYMSPEEKAALEQAEQDRIAEDKRIEELKALCVRKGLSFDEEEAKYQAKLAEKKAKAEKKRQQK